MNQSYLKPITVLISIYNSESFLQKTVDSVLCQTFQDFELIILDDGPTDKSSAIINTFEDPRIKYISCQHNYIATLNKGLTLACGKYIALLEPDNLMLPERLQIQYDYLESHPDIIACGGYMHSFGQDSKVIEAPLDYNDIKETMMIRSPMLNPTGFIRRDAIIEHNIRYQSSYSYAADFKFWSDLVKVGKIINIPKILTLYRTYEKQTDKVLDRETYLGTHIIKQEMIDYFLSMLEEDNKFYPILDEKLLPALDDLGNEHTFFSPDTYFSFMYELIIGINKEKMK